MKFPKGSFPKSLEDLNELELAEALALPKNEGLDRREFLQRGGFMVITAATASSVVSMMLSKFAEAADLSASSVQELQLRMGNGKILVPTSGTAYSEHATVYQSRYQATRPQIIVVVTSSDEVSQVIKWAARNTIPVAVKSGGNCFDGFSTGPGLVIDLGQMKSISIDDASKTMVVGPGARLGNVYQEAYNHRFVLPAGSCPQVAVAGLTQGGGHGLLSRKFGLTTDHLLEAQVVTATGETIRVADDEHSDLFWAIRGGGGGNFGVITQFKFQLHDVVPVCWFSMRWPTSLGYKVFNAWQNFAPYAPDELASIMKVTAQGGVLSRISVVGQFVGTEAQLRATLKPLTDQYDPGSTLSITAASSFMDAVKHFAGGTLDADSAPIFFKASSDYVFDEKKLTEDGFNTLVKSLGAGGVTAVAMCDAYGGAINRVPTSSTAFPHRVGAIYSIQYYTEWSSASQSDSRVAWMKSLRANMAPYVSGQAYVNYCDKGIENYEQAYYASNAPRLRRVKAKYDPPTSAYPNGLFNHAQSVRPTADDSFSFLQMINPSTSSWDGKNPVRAKCWLEGDTLVARYEVKNTNPYLRPGTPSVSAPTPELYKFEVAEIFLSVTGMPTGSLSTKSDVNRFGDRDGVFPYFEFEVSPRNEFLAVKVLSPQVASGDARFDSSFNLPGLVHFAGLKDYGWAAELHIPLRPLGWDGDPKKIVGNLFAILGATGNRSYWSLFLPKQSKPDFHKPRYFERLIQD